MASVKWSRTDLSPVCALVLDAAQVVGRKYMKGDLDRPVDKFSGRWDTITEAASTGKLTFRADISPPAPILMLRMHMRCPLYWLCMARVAALLLTSSLALFLIAPVLLLCSPALCTLIHL